MIKLLCDIKCGFDDLYLTEKDVEFDLADYIIANKEILRNDIDPEDRENYIANFPVEEDKLYEKYKDDLDTLLHRLEEDGIFGCWYEESILNYAHTFFQHICYKKGRKPFIPSIWEPTNFRLFYDPTLKSDCYFFNSLSAKEACDILNFSNQQLYYYVKTGKIRKEYTEDHTKFGYNKDDVYKVAESLKRKGK